MRLWRIHSRSDMQISIKSSKRRRSGLLEVSSNKQIALELMCCRRALSKSQRAQFKNFSANRKFFECQTKTVVTPSILSETWSGEGRYVVHTTVSKNYDCFYSNESQVKDAKMCECSKCVFVAKIWVAKKLLFFSSVFFLFRFLRSFLFRSQ